MNLNPRDQVMEAVRSNLPSEKVAYPETPAFAKTITVMLPAFEERIREAGATLYKPASLAAAQALLEEQYGDASVICSATPDLKGNLDIHSIKNPHDLADVDVGIIRARFGVAENGMVWLTQEDLVVNSLGFLSQHLVILLQPTELVADMYDAYMRVFLDDTAYGCFMMGPSATADIGAVLVHGAQGARSLSVYLV
ncbi:LUD domain-containing protein [Chitinophaga sp. Cy-1792]|uniref:LutC/YkgG family protein n=1 Tax=Chitinophaga sp. Cy-1792 TaxID=2608339 RepID=UPI00141FFD85|nr:LUD domain-containing protein [Chitinophaga sp. Cy-1792]NIG56856.1 hypothetical protein [Chitinophaga sp. Cy-1792]